VAETTQPSLRFFADIRRRTAVQKSNESIVAVEDRLWAALLVGYVSRESCLS